MSENAAMVSALRDRLIAGLSQIPHSALNGDPVNRLPGNISFCFEGIEGESLLLLPDDRGICASSCSACTSDSPDPSHVLPAIGRPHEVAHGSLRLSLVRGKHRSRCGRDFEGRPGDRGLSPQYVTAAERRGHYSSYPPVPFGCLL